MQSCVQPEAMEVNTAVQIIALNSSCEQAGTNNTTAGIGDSDKAVFA